MPSSFHHAQGLPPDSQDPYQLDRLAEELASRESARGAQYSVSDDPDLSPVTDLPEYGPLGHDNPFLTAPVFNVEDFLLSRSRATLSELRTELRDYLATLKEELVQLINNDYEAFISLSTDLKNEGPKLKRMRAPLAELRAKVMESRDELQAIENAIQEKLKKRASLREEKALLHLLLKISESVTRLESLLLIVTPDQDEQSTGLVGMSSSGIPSTPHDDHDEKNRGNHAKHIARVASEYMQLLYHVSKAREEKCAFVDEMQWRIDRIQSTLSSDLDHLFASLLVHIRDSKGDSRFSELERAKWITDLKECLRTYDALGLWRDAEDVLRREVVRPFLRKTVYHSALSTPHSPIVPRTPFQRESFELIPTTGFPLRTPYTPFTAFAPKQELPSQNVHLTAPPAVLREDEDNPLAHLYNRILHFIARDVKDIMEVAEKASSRKLSRERFNSNTPSGVGEVGGFNILANVVWEEIASAVINDIGDIVFASGRPNELRKNYDTTQNFLRYLELYAPSSQAVHSMRNHSLYTEFEKRWQLPVYFQLRWKEIVTDVEEVLSELSVDPTSAKDKSFTLAQTTAVWKALTMCWSPDILIPELSHRFWRLTLQLLSRFIAWLNSVYSGVAATSRSVIAGGLSTEPSSAENVSADESLLRQYAAIISDVKLLEGKVLDLWQQEIKIILPAEIFSNSDGESPDDVLKQMVSRLTVITQPASSQIIAILTKRCCEALLPVRSIPSQFRAMSNKRLPTEPSYFVQTIFRPLKAFFAIGASEGPGRQLKDTFLASYSKEVFNSVAQRYISYLVAMRKTEESLRRLKKGKKTTFSLFGNTKDGDGRDEERIRVQMIMDVEAFGKEAQTLGVDLQNQHYDELKSIVLISDQDET